MKKEGVMVFLLLFAVFLSIFAVSRGFAANDTLDLNITIGEYSEITVLPSVINWTEVALGTASGNRSVTVENTGSLNVTNLYVYGDALTDEYERPYGLANASNYSAASVITVNNLTGNRYFYVGRIEWNWTELVQNLNTTNINNPVSWGFFRNTSIDYVWLVGNGTDGYCNNSGTQFSIEDDPDTGVTETRTPETDSITWNTGDANYSYFSVSRGTSILDTYCVAVPTACDKIYIYKYDKRSGFQDCSNSKFISTSQIAPGNKIQIEVNAFIPRGLPAGELIRATMTFVVT